MQNINIGNYQVGENSPCFIVAEIGINHNGDLELAKKSILAAKNCGVDAVKFQVFKSEEFVSDKNEQFTYKSQGKEVTESMYEMFKRYEFKPEQWKEIFDFCKKNGIEVFVTPQNPSDLDFILSIVKLPVIKVGSDDLTNVSLMDYYAQKHIPMIISAGMAYISEIEDAVTAILKQNNKQIIVLHCVSSYPTDPVEVNLNKILTIKQAFNVIVGFSDHTIGSIAACGAIVLGAKVIEKHFTLDKNLAGPDHWFSSDPQEMSNFVKDIRMMETSLGTKVIEPTSKELEMRKIARRSIVASKNISKGEILNSSNLTVKRPGIGLPPKFISYLMNKTAKTNIKENELISFEKIEGNS